MVMQTAEGASVFWTARVHLEDGQTLLASCRYAGMDGMAFICEQACAIGSEVTIFVASLHASVLTHHGWTEFRLQVAYQTYADGTYRMGCVHKGTSEASLSWLAQALTRLNKQPYGAALAPAKVPPLPRPLSVEAQRRLLKGLLRPGSDAAPLLAYDGAFDTAALAALFSTARSALAASDAPPAQRRKVYTGVVELARNIQQHALEGGEAAAANPGKPLGALQVLTLPAEPGDSSAAYTVSAANRIAPAAAGDLLRLMQDLRQMGLAERQAAYRKLLLRSAAERGARPQPGFGLLTLATESAQPLEWSCTSEALDGQQSHAFWVQVRF